MNKMKQRLLFIFLSLVLYQNCGQFGGGFDLLHYGSTAMSSDQMLDTQHPAGTQPTQSTQKMQIANRTYIAELFREIFTSNTSPVPELESLLQRWVVSRDSQYGLGCDPYSTYSGQDCGGDISAANLPYTTDDNTIRQSFRLQLCDNLLANDNAVKAALEKINVRSLAPNAEGVRQIYKLFYRAEDPSAEVVNALVTLDRTLAEKGESVSDRWRAILLQVCLSPGWQLL